MYLQSKSLVMFQQKVVKQLKIFLPPSLQTLPYPHLMNFPPCVRISAILSSFPHSLKP